MQPDGSFEYVSPSCRRVTGHDAEAFHRRHALLDELIADEDRVLWQGREEQTREGKGPGQLEFRIRAADGRVIWIDHVCEPVRGDDGRFLGVRASNRDVTERKQSEDRLKTALAEIERLRDRLVADNTYLRQQVEPEPGKAPEPGRWPPPRPSQGEQPLFKVGAGPPFGEPPRSCGIPWRESPEWA